MKSLCNFITESTRQLLTSLGDILSESFELAEDKEGVDSILETFEESLGDAAAHLEMDEKTEALSALEAWAKRHKFNL